MPGSNATAGRKAPMSPTYVINLVCISAMVMIVFIQWALACWSLGLDFAPIKCLPGTAYLIRKAPPAIDEVRRGDLYAYASHGLAPLLKDGSSVVKIAAGLPGDRVDVNARGVFINHRWWGPLNPITMARTHRTVASVTRSFTLKSDEVLMLGTLPRTYDGRYWGPIKASWLLGHAWRVW